METRKVAYAVVLTAIAVAGGVLFSFPIGIARVSPTQHMVNVIAAVTVGPWYGIASALAASIIRIAMGTGTPNAFPGSMIGVFIAGYVYLRTRNVYLAALGEIFGTGVLGSLTSVFFVAPVIIQKPVDAMVLSLSFIFSTIAGSIIGVLAVFALGRAGVAIMPKPANPSTR
jgi:energy-coupling factor transport system ATP-binding protein